MSWTVEATVKPRAVHCIKISHCMRGKQVHVLFKLYCLCFREIDRLLCWCLGVVVRIFTKGQALQGQLSVYLKRRSTNDVHEGKKKITLTKPLKE